MGKYGTTVPPMIAVDKIEDLPRRPEYVITREGDVYTLKKGPAKKMRPFLKGPYLYVNIYDSAEKRYRTSAVHRLVAGHFCPVPTDAIEVRHLDGNPLNNHADNLAWGTHQDNMDDQKRHGTYGLRITNSRSASAKINESTVHAIDQLWADGTPSSVILDTLGINWGTLSRVVKRKTWKHVPNRSGPPRKPRPRRAFFRKPA